MAYVEYEADGKTIKARVQQKTDTLANWMANDNIVLAGEQAFVVNDDGTPLNFKIGDGTKPFRDLPNWIDFSNAQRVVAQDPGVLVDDPSEETRYMEVTAIGTYTYGGNTLATITEDGYKATFWWTGTEWVSNGVVRAKGDKGDNGKTIEYFNYYKTGGYLSGSQIIYENVIYEVLDGQTLPMGQNPKDNPDKVKVIYGGVPTSTSTELTIGTTATALRTGIAVKGSDVYTVSHNTNSVFILKNGVQIYLGATDSRPNLLGVCCYIKDDVLHIVYSSANYTLTNQGAYYAQYNITTNTYTVRDNIYTGENTRLSVKNIIEFNSDLYISTSTTGVIASSSLDTSATRAKIHLFKLNGNTWELQALISKYGDYIGDAFTTDTGQLRITVQDTTVTPRDSSLFVENGVLKCVWSSYSGGVSRYLNVVMKTSNNISWSLDKVFRYAVGIHPFAVSNGDMLFNLIQMTNISSPDASSGTMTLKFGEQHTGSYYDTKILNPTWFTVSSNTNGVYIVTTHSATPPVKTVVHFFPWSDILSKTVSVDGVNYRGELNIESPTPTNLKVGDYWKLNGYGVFTALNESLDIYGVTNAYATNKINLNKGDNAIAVWNGYVFVKVLKSSSIESAQTIKTYERYVNRNVFNSNNFRIPVVIETNLKTLLAFTDVRRTSGDDYDEIDIGLLRSFDGGSTWEKDPIIAFQRVVTDGFRVHDTGAVVDKSNGRIYAFGKYWNANVNPFDSAYWKANKDKSIFAVKYSDDNGKTWINEVNLNSLRPSDAWHLSSGASSGIQLSDGTLVQPVYIMYDSGANGGGKSAFVYKNVGSSNWLLGDIVPDFGTDENQIIQLPNGNLLMSCRNVIGAAAEQRRRFYELSSIGSGWAYRDDLDNVRQIAGGCCEPFVRYKNTYIMAQPTTYGTTNRQNTTVFYSYDLENWTPLINVSDPINTNNGGYSSIVVTNDNFGILHESSFGIYYTDLSFFRNILR